MLWVIINPDFNRRTIMNSALRFIIASLLAVGSAADSAEIKVVSEANRGESALPEFKFKTVPAPSATDAANRAKFTIVAGSRDRNGGDLKLLNDGRLPEGEDEPGANLFFAAGSEGGRILVDLGEATDVKRIATYSWHPGSRGPQVYKLYGDDPEAKNFDANSAAADDLAKAGWKLLAEVDARPKKGEPGGQYGVNIARDAGLPVGKHRYLLFDVARTGLDEWFDNTFFSEIDVDDGREHSAPERPKAPKVDVLKFGDKYEIAFDASQAPELKPWVDEKLKPICAAWYPKIVDMLPSRDYAAPNRFAIVFEADMRGVAYTSGRRIVCSASWIADNLDGEAAGAIVHEMVHVVQQYGRARGGNRSPGWLVEGVADYIRWFLYEPEKLRPRPDPVRANYTDSYRTTGAFLDYVTRRHDQEIIKKLNAAMRSGEYSEDLWRQYTGHTAEELWAEYVATLKDQ